MEWPVSVKAVVRHDGCVLLGRNDRDEWELPGGRLEPGETCPQAAAREVLEETGLDVRVGEVLLAEPFEVIPGRWVLVVAYSAEPAGRISLATSYEHREVRFVALDDLGSLPVPNVYRRAVSAALAAPPQPLGPSA